MKQIIPFEKRALGAETVPMVDGRNIYAFLEIARDYADWIKRQIKRARFIENTDYTVFYNHVENPKGGRPSQEYHFTFDAAKSIGMLSATPRGDQVRQYFIDCEKQVHTSQPSLPSVLDAYPDLKALSQMTIAVAENRRSLEMLQAEHATFKDALIVNQRETIQGQALALQAKDLALAALHGQSWMTIRQYVYLHRHDLGSLMTDTRQKAFALHLGTVCLARGAPTYKALTADVVWPEEKTYPLGLIEEMLTPWLTRQGSQVTMALVPRAQEGA